MKETKEKTKFHLFLPKDRKVFEKQRLKNTLYTIANLNSNEGKKYYFRNIVYKGNGNYSDETLDKVLVIHIVDVYNTELLNKR